jgi:hypothetical protein
MALALAWAVDQWHPTLVALVSLVRWVAQQKADVGWSE